MVNLSYIISIDLGGTNVKLALFRRKAKDKVCQSTFPTKEFPSKKLLFNKLIQSVEDLIVNASLTHSDILGVGIGVPGPVDSAKGMIYYFPNIPGWKNVSLKKMLEVRLKVPVFLDNDANLMALAELKFGAAKNARNSICLTLGTGVGGALILNGSLFRGSTSVAGEIGHIPIALDGPVCNCGSKGCLERFIGNSQILAEAKRMFGKKISLEELSRLAKKGNKKAVSIWQDLGFKLGVGLSGLVNVFNPELIVIGGGLSNVGNLLFKEVRRTLNLRAMKTHAGAVKILKAQLGVDAGLLGATILVEENSD